MGGVPSGIGVGFGGGPTRGGGGGGRGGGLTGAGIGAYSTAAAANVDGLARAVSSRVTTLASEVEASEVLGQASKAATAAAGSFASWFSNVSTTVVSSVGEGLSTVGGGKSGVGGAARGFGNGGGYGQGGGARYGIGSGSGGEGTGGPVSGGGLGGTPATGADELPVNGGGDGGGGGGDGLFGGSGGAFAGFGGTAGAAGVAGAAADSVGAVFSGFGSSVAALSRNLPSALNDDGSASLSASLRANLPTSSTTGFAGFSSDEYRRAGGPIGEDGPAGVGNGSSSAAAGGGVASGGNINDSSIGHGFSSDDFRPRPWWGPWRARRCGRSTTAAGQCPLVGDWHGL